MMDIEIEVEFSQLEQEMDVEFEQSDMEMEADFGELQTVNIGLSAYQVAVKNGFEGTEEEWLESLKGPKGDPGISPVVAVEDIDGGHRVTITDKDGEKTFDVMDGEDGAVTEEQIASAVEDYMAEHPVEVTDIVKTVNGIAPDENGNVNVEVGTGGTGADGFSPIASVTQTDSGAVITITDKSGTTTATIVNGKDGADGKDGKDGAQGIPGEQGPKGDTGAPGADGAKGDKGDKGDTGATGAQGKPGANGTNGKSAYAYAQDGGYTGTEEEFATKLAEEAPKLFEVTITKNEDGTYTSSHYYADVKKAYDSGRVPIAVMGVSRYQLFEYSSLYLKRMVFGRQEGSKYITIEVGINSVNVKTTTMATPADIPDISQKPFYLFANQSDDSSYAIIGGYYGYIETGDFTSIEDADEAIRLGRDAFMQGRAVFLLGGYDGEIAIPCTFYDEASALFELSIGVFGYIASVDFESGAVTFGTFEIPEALPNPNPLTINGISYDGSEPVDMTDSINTLIDTKFAEIGIAEEGAY